MDNAQMSIIEINGKIFDFLPQVRHSQFILNGIGMWDMDINDIEWLLRHELASRYSKNFIIQDNALHFVTRGRISKDSLLSKNTSKFFGRWFLRYERHWYPIDYITINTSKKQNGDIKTIEFISHWDIMRIPFVAWSRSILTY